MKTMKSVKKKLCKACGKKYEVKWHCQKWCSYSCAVIIINKIKERADIKKSKKKKKADVLITAQNYFNRYIRMRDLGQPCISCQRHYMCKWNAGHYKSICGNPELRFEPLNCHLQCEPCNTFLSGNIIEYRKNLLLKIGAEKLAWLEGPHKIPKLTIHEIEAISEKYRILHNNTF